jgi:hypothetical protein
MRIGSVRLIGPISGYGPNFNISTSTMSHWFIFFEALNVDGNARSDLAFPIDPTLDKESTGLLDCRWIEAQTPGGVRHIYAALRLRLSRRQGRSRQ